MSLCLVPKKPVQRWYLLSPDTDKGFPILYTLQYRNSDPCIITSSSVCSNSSVVKVCGSKSFQSGSAGRGSVSFRESNLDIVLKFQFESDEPQGLTLGYLKKVNTSTKYSITVLSAKPTFKQLTSQ